MSSPVEPKYGLPKYLTPAIAGLALLVLSWPLLLHPSWLLSHPVGEGNNHYWMLWRAFQDTPVSNLPDGVPIPTMDKINLVWAMPTVLFAPALAYNQVIVANMLLAFAGSWALARELQAGPRGALVAGVAAMSAPALWGVASFGLTEALPVGWLALHATAVLRYGRIGGHRWWVLAGLSLGAFWLGGWYGAAFSIPALLVLHGWTLWRYRRPWGLLGAGLIAGLMVLPAFVEFLGVKEFWAERWQPPADSPPERLPRWRDFPDRGTDLLNFFLPTTVRVPVSKSVYAGLVGLVLALGAGKRGRLLWALVLPLWVLAMGHWWGVAGYTHLLGAPRLMPAGWLTNHVSQLEGLRHWHRAAVPATVFLAAATGLGASRLCARWSWAWIPLVMGIVLESVLLSQNPWPRDQAPTGSPEIYQQLEGPGGIVMLPFDNWRVDFSDTIPRRYNLWQPEMDRPVAENYEGPDALLGKSHLVATADYLCGQRNTTPWRVPSKMHRVEIARTRGTLGLADAGVSYISLHEELCPGHLRARALLEEILGPPFLEAEGVAIWEVE